MASVSVNLHSEATSPISMHVLTLDDGRMFLSIDIGQLGIILPFFDGEAAEFAREVAAALVKGADQCGATQEIGA